MSNAQVWTALGILLGAFVSLITLTLLVVSSKIDNLSGLMDGLGGVDGVRGGFGGLQNEMMARFDGIDQRLESLHRDLQKIAEKLCGS